MKREDRRAPLPASDSLMRYADSLPFHYVFRRSIIFRLDISPPIFARNKTENFADFDAKKGMRCNFLEKAIPDLFHRLCRTGYPARVRQPSKTTGCRRRLYGNFPEKHGIRFLVLAVRS